MAYCYQPILLWDAFLIAILFPRSCFTAGNHISARYAFHYLLAGLFCMILLSSADFFFKINYLKNLFQEQYQNLKWFASKLFADKSQL